MGFALLGEHRQTQLPVAIKGLHQAESAQQRRLFMREARSLAALEHEGIIELIDYGEVDEPDQALAEGALYLVMEYADGGELEVADIAGWADLEDLCLQVLDALAHAHSRHRLHLDLKPENILKVSTDEGTRYRIADFGIARITTDFEEPHPSAGTPLYMAPEQTREQWRMLGPWSDLYALGCLIWELATGAPPFQESTAMATMLAHLSKEAPAFAPRFECPPGFETWLRQLMAKEPGQRFPDSATAGYALVALGRGWASPEGAPRARAVGANKSAAATQVATYARTTLDLAHWETTSIDKSPTVIGDALEGLSEPTQTGPRRHFEQPPYPVIFRQVLDRKGHRFQDLGLGLFSLRPIPFVNRRDLLQSLWHTMGQTIDKCRPQAVLLSGESGVGKSRLMQEFAVRQVELGQARVLRFDFEERHWSQAVAQGLRRFFNAVGADAEELARLVDFYMSTGTAEERASVVDWLQQSPAEQRQMLSTQWLGACLAALSRRRPLIVLCDGVGLYTFPLDLQEDFCAAVDDAPVFFVLAVATTGVTHLTKGRIDAFAGECYEMRSLSSDDVKKSLRQMMPLSADEIERLGGYVGDELELGRQVLALWLEAQVLELGPQGYDGPAALPADLTQVWLARLQLVVGPGQFEGARKALAVAAALGSVVDQENWHDACARLEIEVADRLVERASRQGFVVDAPETLIFSESSFRRAMLADLDEEADGPQIWRVCAQVLEEREDFRSQIRAVKCFENSGDYERALEVLGDLAWRSPLRDSEAMGQWFKDLTEAAPGLDLVQQAQTLSVRAFDLLQNCEFPAADKLLAQVVQISERCSGWRMQQIEKNAFATRHHFANNPRAGLAIAETLPAYWNEETPRSAKVSDLHLLSELYLFALQPDKAWARLEEAMPMVVEEGPIHVLWEKYQRAAVEVFRQNYGAARQLLLDIKQSFAEEDDLFGLCLCRELLADIDVANGQWIAGEQRLNKAIDEAQRTGYYGEYTFRGKLGRLYAQSGRAEEALQQLAQVEEQARERGFNILVWYYFDAQAEAHGHRQDWESLERVFGRAQSCMACPGIRTPVIVATWQRVIDLLPPERGDLADRIGEEAKAIAAAPLVMPGDRGAD